MIAADRYANAPAQQVAHRFHVLPIRPGDLRVAWDYAQTGGRVGGGRVIVEGFIAFEVSPRPHDTGMVTMVTQWQNEFELHARAMLGLPTDVSLRNCGASHVIYGGVDAHAIVFEGVEQALRLPGVDLRLFGKPESFRKRRMGVALARASEVQSARALAAEAARTVKPGAVK